MVKTSDVLRGMDCSICKRKIGVDHSVVTSAKRLRGLDVHFVAHTGCMKKLVEDAPTDQTRKAAQYERRQEAWAAADAETHRVEQEFNDLRDRILTTGDPFPDD